MRRLTRAVIFVLAAMCTVPAWAARSASTAAGQSRVSAVMDKSERYPGFDKLGRGAGNVLTGWLEIPLAIRQRYVSRDPVGTFATGTAVGLVKGVTRTLVGAYETVTFFLPYPNNFGPILPPLEYFSQAPPGRR